MGVARRRRRKMGDFQPKTVFFYILGFPCRTPPRGGGWGSDLKFLSFWTLFLKFLSPMRRGTVSFPRWLVPGIPSRLVVGSRLGSLTM